MTRGLRLVLVVAALLALSACGDDGTPAPNADGTTGTTTAPGTTPAPAARTRPDGIFGAPTAGAPADHPRGVVLLLHGGAWVASTDQVLTLTNQGTEAYRANGFATDVVRLGTGRGAIDSATKAYDRVRTRYGARTPICAIGNSSGGHVALMLAIARKDLACAVVNAAPTDLAQWRTEVPGAAAAEQAAFGGDTKGLSPATRAGEIRARVLLQYAKEDPAVPPAEGRVFLAARPRGTTLVLLDPGDAFFVHSGIATSESAQVVPRQLRFLQDAASAEGR